MNSEKQLRKAAKHLRKAAKAAKHNSHYDRELTWTSVFAAPAKSNNRTRDSYWVDARTKGKGKTSSYYTVCETQWTLGEAVYIALMQPKVAEMLAAMFEASAAWMFDGWGKHYSPDSRLGLEIELAKHINKTWKERAKRDA